MAVHVFRFESPRADHRFIGTWHIYAMEVWDASYLNMEVQAFIQIRPDNRGSFQFGLVSGELDGSLEGNPPEQRFVFTWGGSDEMEPAHGSGWLRLKSDDEIRGVIRIHHGDRSKLKARRIAHE